MSDAVFAVLVWMDRVAGPVSAAIHNFEPQIYGAILIAALLWFFAFPRDDADQI
jgi:hypothetical protein